MTESKQNRPGRFLLDLDSANYLSLFDEFSDGVLVTNADGIIVYYNQAMSRIDEILPDQALSQKITDIYDLDDTTSLVLQCLAKRTAIIDEPIYYRTRMGKFANTIHTVMPIFNRNKLVGAICFVKDYHVMAETMAAMPLPDHNRQFDIAAITFERIIGTEPAFIDALHAARMAAGTPSPIMLF
jgi:arginine utilization regulatory protein